MADLFEGFGTIFKNKDGHLCTGFIPTPKQLSEIMKEPEMSTSYGGLTSGFYKIVNGEKVKIDPKQEQIDKFKEDCDWQCAFYEAFNHQYQWGNVENHPINALEEIIAYEDGENDERDWIGVFLLKSPYHCYAVVAAGCDYTGWDCQAGGAVEFYQDINAAVSKLALTNDMRARLEGQLRQKEKEGRLKLDWEEE